MLELYENIRALRFHHCMTQSELAERTGYKDKGMISRIERGLGTDPINLMGNSWDQSDYIVGNLTASEQLLLNEYRQLNDEGQELAANQVHVMVASGLYIKNHQSDVVEEEA